MPQSIALLFCNHESGHASVNGWLPDGRLDTLGRQVIAVLRPTEFRLLPWANWQDFWRCAAATHAAVIVAERLDVEGATTGLHEKRYDDFPCPLILVTDSERENLRHLRHVRVDRVVYADEVGCLAQLVTSIALSEGRRLLRAAIRRGGLHATLRRALLKLVDVPLAEPIQDASQYRRFPRTVIDLAALADVSADYLRHLAATAQLPIGRVLHRYAALQALEMLAAGVRARVVVARFGYREMSGIDKLVLRNLGGRPRDLLQSGLQPHYAHTARLIGKEPLNTDPIFFAIT